MKQEFSIQWKSSVQPRKQRKYRANAPQHVLRDFMASPLDKTLQKKYGRRSFGVVKGDEVKIMRGSFKGKQGKVGEVEVKRTRLQVEGVQRTKKGGEKLKTWFHPSKVKIISIHDKDGKRMKKLGVVKQDVQSKMEVRENAQKAK